MGCGMWYQNWSNGQDGRVYGHLGIQKMKSLGARRAYSENFHIGNPERV